MSPLSAAHNAFQGRPLKVAELRVVWRLKSKPDQSSSTGFGELLLASSTGLSGAGGGATVRLPFLATTTTVWSLASCLNVNGIAQYIATWPLAARLARVAFARCSRQGGQSVLVCARVCQRAPLCVRVRAFARVSSVQQLDTIWIRAPSRLSGLVGKRYAKGCRQF